MTRMNKTIPALVLSTCCLLLPSCITSTLAAASGAGSLTEAASLTSGISALFSSSAPESLAGHVVTFEGEYRGADQTSTQTSDAISFGKTGTATRTVNGNSQSLTYTRKGEKKAIITSTGNTTETYRLTFTSGNEGTYTFERRGEAGDFATGDGTFSIK